MSLIREPFRLILAGDASSEDRELNKIGHCKVGLPSPPAPLPKERQGGFIQGNEKHDVVDSPKLSGLVEQCAIPAFLLT